MDFTWKGTTSLSSGAAEIQQLRQMRQLVTEIEIGVKGDVNSRDVANIIVAPNSFGIPRGEPFLS